MSLFGFNTVGYDTFNIINLIPIFQFLSKDPNEDQTNGNVNANGNYADAGLGLTKFKIKAPPGYFLILNRMIVSVRDTGAIDSGFYGNGITLTNGINLYVKDDNLEEDRIITGVPIKTNPDWGIYCFDTDASGYGTGDNQLLVRWTFNRMGRPVILDGDVNEEAGLILNDNFSELVHHYFQVQGLLFPKRDLS